jgi:hypothetical protein
MNTDDLLETQTHPHKELLKSICRRVFEKFDERPGWQMIQLLNDVDEVLKGGPTPCLSNKERMAVKAEAARLGELGS